MAQLLESPDPVALADYLEDSVEGFRGPLSIEKFSDGQSNPTFKVAAASGIYVLRSQPPGTLLKSAHAVDREFRVMAALADTDVPVPMVYHLCENRDVIGAMFYLMEFCDGRIFWSATLLDVGKADRSAIYAEMIRVLAAVHTVDTNAVGLDDFGKPGSYFERQFGRWNEQYRASEIEKIEAMEELIAWLAINLPHDDGRACLVHGDYRLDNMVFHATDNRTIALLDWELSTLGHPLADVGYLCMQMRMPARVGSISGLRGADLEALGIPTEQECLDMYCDAASIDTIENFPVYVAFSFFRLAAIIQGVAKRAVDGNASNKNATELGGYVQIMAELGLEATRELQ